jgi:hypothetical protein
VTYASAAIKNNQIATIKERTLELLCQQVKSRCTNKNTPHTDALEKMTTKSTDLFFYLDDDCRDDSPGRFLASSEAKGIITPQTIRKFSENTGLNNASGSWLYTTTVKSWTRALFELRWRPRTKQIQREQREEIKKIGRKSRTKRRETRGREKKTRTGNTKTKGR